MRMYEIVVVKEKRIGYPLKIKKTKNKEETLKMKTNEGLEKHSCRSQNREKTGKLKDELYQIQEQTHPSPGGKTRRTPGIYPT
jgi:hypothetical protein